MLLFLGLCCELFPGCLSDSAPFDAAACLPSGVWYPMLLGWGGEPPVRIYLHHNKETLTRFHTEANFRVLVPGIMEPENLCINRCCFYLLET